MVKCKNPKVRDGTRWQIPKAQKNFFDGLCRTNRRAVKRIIFEKKRIITKGLSRDLEVEQKFHGYDLGCTTRGGNSFCPTLVREFYENYQSLLENMCREGEKIAHQPLLDKVSVWGVMVDVSEETINRFLHGLNFTPQATSTTFYARLKHRKNQQNCLAILIADGESEWLTNLSKRIFKASLTSEVRVWWGILRTWLMPIDGDNILGDDRAILFARFVANLKLNFGEIITKKIKIRVSRFDIAYPIPCLITRLCRATNVPKIVGLEKELFARKTHNLIQNEENQPRLMLDRDAEIPSDPVVTGTSSSPNAEVSNFEAIPPISAIMIESSVPRTEIISSTVVPITEFAFNPMNFMRVAKQSKLCEAQLKIFAKKFTAIVEKRAKSRERSAPEMELFRLDLDKVKAEVGKLQQHHFMVSIDPTAEESEG
ncbi:hypothetical protein BC332_24065 [Capsicum chinense]|nr:hypothetical protein BC332_24065 [Capsicum chinense]